MDKNIQRIVEGFFNSPANGRAKMPVSNMHFRRDELKGKLLRAEWLSDEEWEFVDDSMDGYVPVDNTLLRWLCVQSINSYGPNVSLNWIDTSGVTDMRMLFFMYEKPNGGATYQGNYLSDYYAKFNGDVSHWDTSGVTNMHGTFYKCKSFNRDISAWDVSRVTDMSGMFSQCTEFNCDLSGWDTSSVTNMACMFEYCKNFNCDLSGWDVSSVTDMHLMFRHCEKFSCDLTEWRKTVESINAVNMFVYCPHFHQVMADGNMYYGYPDPS